MALYWSTEIYSRDNYYMNKREIKQSWKDLCYKIDPELSEPTPTYIFRNGQRVFYSPDRNKKRVK
jgi:L-rhamnose mutarotase